MKMSMKHWFLLLVTATLFGSSFLFNNIAVSEIPPLSFAALRVGIAALFMVIVLIVTKHKLPPLGRAWWPLFVLGVLTSAVPYFTIAWGQARISSSLGGILFATIPVFTILIAPIVTDEGRITLPKLIGVVVAFAGVILAIGPGVLGGVSTQLAGAAMTLLAAFSYSMGSIYARLQGGLSPMVMATGQLLMASLILVPLSIMLDPPISLDVSGTVIAAVLAVALASTALPVLLMFWLVRNAGVTNTSNLAFFIPVAAVVLGAFALGEAIAPSTIAGFALVLLGALLATGTLVNFFARTARQQRRH
jgi:drug/metabolite transporter (DMT)-like permease